MVRNLLKRAENGVGKLTLFVFTAIIGTAIFLIFEIMPFYYYFFELENQFQAHIRVASTHTDQELREKIEYHLKKLQIPADPDDLRIDRSHDSMLISLKYIEVFEVYWDGKYHTLYKFPFHAKVEGRF